MIIASLVDTIGKTIIAVIFGVVALFVLFLYVLIVYYDRQDRKCKQKVRTRGRLVRGCWVQANRLLYEEGEHDLPALAVFTFDERAASQQQFLLRIAGAMANLKEQEPRNKVEAEVAAMIRDERYRPGKRTLLPKEFTGHVPVYAAHVLVERRLLPEGRITVPYTYLMAMPGDEETLTIMVEPVTTRV